MSTNRTGDDWIADYPQLLSDLEQIGRATYISNAKTPDLGRRITDEGANILSELGEQALYQYLNGVDAAGRIMRQAEHKTHDCDTPMQRVINGLSLAANNFVFTATVALLRMSIRMKSHNDLRAGGITAERARYRMRAAIRLARILSTRRGAPLRVGIRPTATINNREWYPLAVLGDPHTPGSLTIETETPLYDPALWYQA